MVAAAAAGPAAAVCSKMSRKARACRSLLTYTSQTHNCDTAHDGVLQCLDCKPLCAKAQRSDSCTWLLRLAASASGCPAASGSECAAAPNAAMAASWEACSAACSCSAARRSSSRSTSGSALSCYDTQSKSCIARHMCRCALSVSQVSVHRRHGLFAEWWRALCRAC